MNTYGAPNEVTANISRKEAETELRDMLDELDYDSAEEI